MEIIYEISILGGVCIKFGNVDRIVGIYHEGCNLLYVFPEKKDEYLNLINDMLDQYGLPTDGRINTDVLTYDILNVETE